jgi:tripartite-type tricarboxylate transporter receptor subunit TctC
MHTTIGRPAFIAALASVCLTAPVVAQSSYPDRAVKIEVGYAAGGPLDVVARLLGDKLAQIWGKPVVVENISGASGNIAADRVAKAAPDGYTLLLASNVNIAVNPKLYKSMPFDPLKDLVPITQVCYSPNILVVPNDLPVKSVQELVAYAKDNPSKLSYASAGVGTTQHLAGELFKTIAKIDIQHVPYRGAAPAVTDLLGGRVSMFFGPPSSLLGLVKEGKVRALAVTSARRFPAAPDLPTMIEAGYPGFVSVLSLGWMAPVGTPKDVLEKDLRGHREGARSARRPRAAAEDRERADGHLACRVSGRHPPRSAAMGRGDQSRGPYRDGIARPRSLPSGFFAAAELLAYRVAHLSEAQDSLRRARHLLVAVRHPSRRGEFIQLRLDRCPWSTRRPASARAASSCAWRYRA